MTQKQSTITALVLMGGAGVAAFLGQWLPANLFAIAALAFLLAAILRAPTSQVSEREDSGATETSVKRSPEEIRQVREYREQHPAATILEAVAAVEEQR